MGQYELRPIDQYTTQRRIIDAMTRCRNFDDFLDFIGKGVFLVKINTESNGHMGPQHLKKCVAAALHFKNAALIPDAGNLRHTFARIMGLSNGKIITEEDEAGYYKFRFPELQLTDIELKRITDKISIEDFMTVDENAEKSVLIFNAIEGLKTVDSCSGHEYVPRMFAFSHLDFLDQESRISREEFQSILDDTFDQHDPELFTALIIQKKNYFHLYCFHIPPSEWVREHNQTSPRELCRSNLEFLKAEFNYEPDYNCYKKRINDSTVQSIEAVRRQINAYINEYTEKEDSLAKLRALYKRRFIYEKNYKEYYQSQEAADMMKYFWKGIEKAGETLRRDQR